MKSTPTLTIKEAISTFAAAALASCIAVALLSTVAFLLQRDGKPLGQLAAAERACAHHNYQSERRVCMHAWLAASRPGTVVRR